jgi:hypothetical protein
MNSIKKGAFTAAVAFTALLSLGCAEKEEAAPQDAVPAKEAVLDKAQKDVEAAKQMAADAKVKAEEMTEAAKEKAVEIKEDAEVMVEQAKDKAVELKEAAEESELMQQAEEVKNSLMEMKN